MKTRNKIWLSLLVFLIVIPFCFPKYAHYEVLDKEYDWGRLKLRTTTHFTNRKENTGYLRVSIDAWANSQGAESCELILPTFEVFSNSLLQPKGGLWIGKLEDFRNYPEKNSDISLVAAWGSRHAKITDVDIIADIVMGENCENPNRKVQVKETLKRELRFHTLWNFLFELMMSV